MTGSIRRGLLATLLVLAFVAPGGVAYALWTSTSTATVSVSIASPSFTLSCDGKKGNEKFVVTWTAVSGVSSYGVYTAATNQTTQFQSVGTTAGISFDVPHNTNGTIFVRVRGVAGSAAPTPFSNTLQITRSTTSGQGASFECRAVTP